MLSAKLLGCGNLSYVRSDYFSVFRICHVLGNSVHVLSYAHLLSFGVWHKYSY
jgi:hypothetical protein